MISESIYRAMIIAKENLDSFADYKKTDSKISDSESKQANQLENCPPESCTTMDWEKRAQLLPIPNYEKSIDDKGRLILKSGNFQVWMPDDSPNAEEYGRILLYQLPLSYDYIKNKLGRGAFLNSDEIIAEYVINLKNIGECCNLEDGKIKISWRIGVNQQEYLKEISLSSKYSAYMKTLDWSKAEGDHELAHRFMYDTELSIFLNEGLATYIQSNKKIDCRDGGYYYDNEFTLYSHLACADGRWHIYASGACLWRRAESKYGLETIQKIIDKLYDKKDRESYLTYYPNGANGSPYATWTSWTGQLLVDLNQAFIPVVGDKFWVDFEDFGFSPTMDQGMSYNIETELEKKACKIIE